MSDALPLPPRPNLEQYRKLSKEFQAAARSDTPGAIRDWAARWPSISGEAIERRWLKFKKTNQRAARCTLADAQFFVARGHGFATWPKFAKHLEALARENSPVSRFETAADAIVAGDLPALETLLRESPELVRARSTREHRSTLLHYVSANGVEDFRQKTPANIVAITRLLLQSGAAVNAESDAYGGRSTTLGLTASSWHPQQAGVQLPLMALLIEHGANIDGPDGGSAVNGCLANGRREAAEFLANQGAKLDLEGAAGVGRLDVVRSFFREDGSLQPPATPKQMSDAFAWAAEFGRTAIVEFLLQRGVDIQTKLRHDGQTALHWAALGGHLPTVKLLLERGAPIDARDESYGGTPLGWALYGWGNAAKPEPSCYEVVALLVRAGATLDPEWYEDDEDRRRALARMRADPRMLAALRGEST